MKLPPLCLLFRVAVLLSLMSSAGILVSLPAEETPPSGVEKSPSNLADLMQDRNLWPSQLMLKVPVRLTIVSNGKEVGSIVSPEGSTVDLVSVSGTALEIKVGAADASVAADQTDLWERVAAASKKSNSGTASPTPNPPASPVNPLPIPASPPPAPSPPPTTTASLASGPPLQLDYEVRPRDNFTKAAFRFWSPAYQQSIRGIIVLVPGSDGDGRGMASDPQWQSLAQKYRLALVGCFLQGGYCHVERGSGVALFDALKEFGEEAAHPELAQAPLLLYGESAGGQFNYNFVLWKPERIMCFVVNKGGYYNHDEPDAQMRSVPGLFFLGMTDADYRINAITNIWTEGRSRGALWALAPQPNSGHEFSKTAAVAQVYFEAVLKNRLQDELLTTDDTPLMKPMQENQGWLGDMTTHEIHDGSTDSQANYGAAWLPDESSARAWKGFVSN